VSQPCSAPQLVLFDADLFATSDTAGALAALVAAHDIPRGAVSDRPDIAARLEDEGAAQWFDFWLAGDGADWPFERALALVSVEPQRALLVSDAATAVRAAENAGLRACPADLEELERQLA
jgi:FMN phosphatase YigB (HAD superfamily)